MGEPMGVTIFVFELVGINFGGVRRMYGGKISCRAALGRATVGMLSWMIFAKNTARVSSAYENITINKNIGLREFIGAQYCRGGGIVSRKSWDLWLAYVVEYGGVVGFHRKSGTERNYMSARVWK